MQSLPLLLIFLLHLFSFSSAASNNDANSPEPGNSDDHKNEAILETMDMIFGGLSYKLSKDEPVDFDRANDIIHEYMMTIKENLCYSCIDGCRVYSYDNGRRNLEAWLNVIGPKQYRMITGMEPVIVRFKHWRQLFRILSVIIG